MDTYFELSDGAYAVRIEPLRFLYDAGSDWDKNWVESRVLIKASGFSGEYLAEFMTVDFKRFRQEFNALYDNLSGYAWFHDLEGYLEMKITGDGIGHFEVNIKACDKPGIYGSCLTFSLNFDQTYIKKLTNKLDEIIKEFPVSGNLK